MNDQEIRDAILEAAYNAAKEAGGIKVGLFNLYEVSKDWGEEKTKIDFNADYLDGKNWVVRETQGGGMRITAEGVDEYEKTHGRGDYGKHGCLAH